MSAPAGDGPPGPTADVVVVAAGSSTRMGGRDKLSASLGGRPLLAVTLDAIAAARSVRRIIVVAAPSRVDALAGAAWLPPAVAGVVAGGRRRQESVAAGVAALGEPGGTDLPAPVVLVHDGARPLVSPGLVDRVAAAAAEHGAAIPVVPVVESLKRVEGDRIGATVEREGLAAAQTPQGIRRAVLAAAYAAYPPAGPVTFTDEAALLEACKIPVHAIPGEPTNLKVTLPDDLDRAAMILAHREGRPFPPAANLPDHSAPGGALPFRVGLGDDVHPFGPGEPLVLGGLSIAGAPRLHGHSDGDVVLHAVCDALLGAAGLGDLGRIFPAGPATAPGIASAPMLAECLGRVRAAGWRPSSIDVTIVAARPKLAGRLPEMAASVARLLALPADAVNVKASTGNQAGWEGAGRGIAARAIAVLARETRE